MTLTRLSVSAILLTVAGSAYALDDVKNSPHNLSATSGPGTIKLSAAPINPVDSAAHDEICVFCHTPHGGLPWSQMEAPLWNRAVSTQSFTMYSSPTINMDIAGQPQGVSMACLSCHDGTVGFDQLRNGPGPADFDTNAASRSWTFAGGTNMTASTYAYLDTDLSNDHPISITYNITQDTMFNAMSANLRFFGSNSDMVECATCHNPHDPTNRPFLRVANTQSTLCLTCHIK